MGDTITVACARPNGLVLRIFDWTEVPEPMQGGGSKMVKRSVEVDRIKLNGYWDIIPREERDSPRAMTARHGLTHGVDKALYEKWVHQNKENPLVKNKIVFGASEPTVKEVAKELQGEQRYKGHDPLDPTVVFNNGIGRPKDPRFPRKVDGTPAIEPADRKSA